MTVSDAAIIAIMTGPPILICLAVFLLRTFVKYSRHHQQFAAVRSTMWQRRRADAQAALPTAQQASITRNDADADESDIIICRQIRDKRIMEKFMFHTVADENTDIPHTQPASNNDNDDDEENPNLDEEIQEWSSISFESFCNRTMLPSSRRESQMEECCICLDGYTAGEVICASKVKECEHVFHKDCLLEWIKNHDPCPLCRVDLMR
jgi:hypothetical protein